MRAAHRAKQPPVQHWLACVDGKPVAYFNSWSGIDGVGQVEDLFTHPEFRHWGIATALIYRCVADARGKGAGPVVIVADATDTPKRHTWHGLHAGRDLLPLPQAAGLAGLGEAPNYRLDETFP